MTLMGLGQGITERGFPGPLWTPGHSQCGQPPDRVLIPGFRSPQSPESPGHSSHHLSPALAKPPSSQGPVQEGDGAPHPSPPTPPHSEPCQA